MAKGMRKLPKPKPPRADTKMQGVTMEKLQEAFLMGCTDKEACLFAGISPKTLYLYEEKNPAYHDLKLQWKEQPFLDARRTITTSIKTNPQYAFEYMKRKKKDEFSERVEQTGKDGKDFTPLVVRIISNEQK